MSEKTVKLLNTKLIKRLDCEANALYALAKVVGAYDTNRAEALRGEARASLRRINSLNLGGSL